MVFNILIAVGLFGIGLSTGYHIQTKQLDEKAKNIDKLLEELKTKNNKMVQNIAWVYEQNPEVDHSQFSEFDEILMNMWID